MPIEEKKLATATLRHQIAEEIRGAILNGYLRPGERVVERAIAAKLGTSLTVAREALIQLEAEGLITKRTNSTTHVTELSQKEIEQIFAVRQVLEEYAFIEAARQGTEQEIATLKKIRQNVLRAAKAGEARAYIEQDLAWHHAVWKMSHNDYLFAALCRTVLPLFGFSLIEAAMREGFNLDEDARCHEPLMQAVVAHDAPAARKAYRTAAESWSAVAKGEATKFATNKQESPSVTRPGGRPPRGKTPGSSAGQLARGPR